MARDLIHYAVKNALIKDGWNIANDPMTLKSKGTRVFIDLEATKFLLATKEKDSIAIEIKTFRNLYVLDDFYSALGKYLCYKLLLKNLKMEHFLYLGITNVTYKRLLQSSLVVDAIAAYELKFVIIHSKKEKVLQWIK